MRSSFPKLTKEILLLWLPFCLRPSFEPAWTDPKSALKTLILPNSSITGMQDDFCNLLKHFMFSPLRPTKVLVLYRQCGKIHHLI